jgi:hypothetical protein
MDRLVLSEQSAECGVIVFKERKSRLEKSAIQK